MNIAIEQGRVICPWQNMDITTNVYIAQDSIVSLGSPPKNFKVDRTINANGLLVLPGLVDAYGYFKDHHGEVSQNQIQMASQAGFTTLFCSPKGQLITDNATKAKKVIQDDHPIDIEPIGALTQSLEGEQIADLTALKLAGCRVFTQDLNPMKDLCTLRSCYLYAASFDFKVIIFAQEPSLSDGVIHEGVVSAMTGLKGIPYSAETIAVATQLQLIEETGVRAHFSHVTCSKSIDLIAQAQQNGLPVTADCTMHHLHLSEIDVVDMHPNTHVIPPLRSTTDLSALRRGLEKGILCAITSSHQPLPSLAKQAPFAETTPGISNLPLMLSLGLHLVNQRHVSLMTMIKSLSSGPLQAYDYQPLAIQAGMPADLCLVDPQEYWIVNQNHFDQQSLNNPFLGWELPGQITHTLKRGVLTYALSEKQNDALIA